MTQPRIRHMMACFVMVASANLCLPVVAGESFSLLDNDQLEQHLEFISSAPEVEILGLTDQTETLSRNIESVSDSGPVLEINSPIGFDLVSPVDIDLSAKPREGYPVNMDSLKVEYKSFVWFDVTKRVNANATFLSDRVFAENVDLPSGNHKLRISLMDQNGGLTSTIVTFKVRKK